MNLEQKVMAEMKEAMKSKDEATLRGLRAIKAEIIKAKTEPGAGGEISSEKEVSLLQKMMVDEMADFYYQTFMTMADTYARATRQTELVNDIKKFAQDFYHKFQDIQMKENKAT